MHGGDGLRVQVAQAAGETVAECCLFGREAGGVQFEARAGEFGQGFQLVGVVPDEAEIGADLVNQPGGGGAALAVFQGREIGGGDFQGGGHVLLQYAALRAQSAEFFTKRCHVRMRRSRMRTEPVLAACGCAMARMCERREGALSQWGSSRERISPLPVMISMQRNWLE